MKKNIIKLKNDVVFKMLFVRHPDILRVFLEDILDLKRDSIKELKILNPEMPPEFVFGKFSRLDLVILVNDENINIELQIKNENNYSERSLFHWAKLYTSDLEQGYDYSSLKRTITVNILGFNLFKCPEYHSVFTAMETTRHEVLSDKLSIHFFELKKLGKELDKNNTKELWLQLINAESEEELDMLTKTDAPEIKNAVVALKSMSDDANVREMARMREKALWDETSALNSAERKGRAEGKAEGRAEGIEALSSQLRKLGISEDMINKAVANL
jgi:predicted transposase/invertase (TIGR01784 family)